RRRSGERRERIVGFPTVQPAARDGILASQHRDHGARMTTQTAPENIATVVRTEVERTIQRSRRGIDVLLNRDEPDVGMTPKDVIYARGTLRLYHYRPLAEEVY